jgi:hypothetical protein
MASAAGRQRRSAFGRVVRWWKASCGVPRPAARRWVRFGIEEALLVVYRSLAELIVVAYLVVFVFIGSPGQPGHRRASARAVGQR